MNNIDNFTKKVNGIIAKRKEKASKESERLDKMEKGFKTLLLSIEEGSERNKKTIDDKIKSGDQEIKIELETKTKSILEDISTLKGHLKDLSIDLEDKHSENKQYTAKNIKDLDDKISGLDKSTDDQSKELIKYLKNLDESTNDKVKKIEDSLGIQLAKAERELSGLIKNKQVSPHTIQSHMDTNARGSQLNRLTNGDTKDFVDDLHVHDPAPILEKVQPMIQNAVSGVSVGGGLNLGIKEEGKQFINQVNEITFRDATVTNKGGGRVEIDATYNPEVNYIDFDTTVTSDSKIGRMRWNDTDRCLEYDSHVDGEIVTNQVGQETWIRVRNNTAAIIPNGKAVYVTGAVGNRPTIALAKADSEATSLTYIGITTQTIGINEDGFVTVRGSVRGVNTNAFTAGNILYVSPTTAGELTETRPVPPNQVIGVGICTVKSGTGEIGVDGRIQPNIERLSNIFVDAISNGDLLIWNNTNNRWENGKQIGDGTNYTEFGSDGDVVFNGTAGLAFGEIYVMDNVTTTTFAGTGVANKSQITIFTTNGHSNNTTPDHTNDHITVIKAGKYMVNISMVIESTTAVASVIGVELFKNNGATAFANVHMNRRLSGGVGTDKGSTSMSGIVDLAANDTVEVWIWNDTNTNAIVVSDITLSIVQVGG